MYNKLSALYNKKNKLSSELLEVLHEAPLNKELAADLWKKFKQSVEVYEAYKEKIVVRVNG